MNPSSTKILIALLVVLVLTPPLLAKQEYRAVDVVICLDTSGSMEPLLDSARARIWDIVNELAGMTPTPKLRVGVLAYGTDRGTAENGWVIIETDLTDDLDSVYARLMALTTSGSEEHVGRVLDTAVETMSWSPDWDALRIVFIAGNESAQQGVETFDFRDAAARAQDEDILVNAIFAGSREQGIQDGWPAIAQHGQGNFSAIDPATGTIQIPTPQDETLMTLNQSLNTTYLPYGPRGEAGLANQRTQDLNASRLGVQSCSSRIVAKGTALYTNAAWDLVDKALEDSFRWSLVHDDDLPAEMRPLDAQGRIAYVEKKRAEREAIQLTIQEVSDQREAFLKVAQWRQSPGGGVSLDDAMRLAIRSQAAAKGFACQDC
jgi:hypothetical protein